MLTRRGILLASVAAGVAMKAYGVSGRDQLRLLRYTASSFLRSPRRFLLPPAKTESAEGIEGGANPTNQQISPEAPMPARQSGADDAQILKR